MEEFRVDSAHRHQLLMRAPLRDAAFFEDDDFVCIANGRGSMRDYNRGSAFDTFGEIVENRALGLGIDAESASSRTTTLGL